MANLICPRYFVLEEQYRTSLDEWSLVCTEGKSSVKEVVTPAPRVAEECFHQLSGRFPSLWWGGWRNRARGQGERNQGQPVNQEPFDDRELGNSRIC